MGKEERFNGRWDFIYSNDNLNISLYIITPVLNFYLNIAISYKRNGWSRVFI
jgi:hypothetical protein